MTANTGRLPTLFIPHGGGPWPFMRATPNGPGEGDGSWAGLDAYLRHLDTELGQRPKAVLVISGHWEEQVPTVNTGAHPGLVFDYFGFPAHTYRLTYPAPGSPELAGRVRALLEAAGIASAEDDARGYDHGVFIPFMLIYPDAQVPIVQLSLRHDLDPQAHLALGRALAPLRDEGVLIVGSGMSYHNLRAIWSPAAKADADAEAFDSWLTHAVEMADPEARNQALLAWERAPSAHESHPRSEHLTPLFVAAGAAGDDLGRRTFADRVFGKAYSGFQFG